MNRANYKWTTSIEDLVVNGILIPFYNSFGLERIPCNDPKEQFKDIDCYIKNHPIQEKSGTIYKDKLCFEVYNNIFAPEDRGLKGWGLITEAVRHIFGYRGCRDNNINEKGVYVASVLSKTIKEICESAIETQKFIDIVNSYRFQINNGKKDQFPYEQCKLNNGIEVTVKCNSSEMKNGGVKYAVIIDVKYKDIYGHKNLYKLEGNSYKLIQK